MKTLFDAIAKAIPHTSHICLTHDIHQHRVIAFDVLAEGIDHRLHVTVNLNQRLADFIDTKPAIRQNTSAIVELCQKAVHEKVFLTLLNARLQEHGITHTKLQAVREEQLDNGPLLQESDPGRIEIYSQHEPIP